MASVQLFKDFAIEIVLKYHLVRKKCISRFYVNQTFQKKYSIVWFSLFLGEIGKKGNAEFETSTW